MTYFKRSMLYQVVHSTLGRYRIRVPKLTDIEFAQTVSQRLGSLQFVKEVRINSTASSLVVSCKASASNNKDILELILACIEQAAISPQDANLDLSNSKEVDTEELDLIPEVNQWKDLGMPFLSLGLAILAVPLELPALLVGTAIAGAALPWFTRATNSIVNHHHPNIALLDSVWMTLQTVQGQYIAPALKTSLVEIRRTLRGSSEKTREQKAFDILNCLSRDVWVERDGFEQTISARELQVGDCITVRSGDFIPVDGTIISGTGLLDCCHLTGKANPVHCYAGQDIYASFILLEGELSIRVKRTLHNTRISLAANLIQSAPVHDIQIGIHQAEFVKNAILPTLLLGGTIFAATGNLGAAISPFQFDFGSGIPISISTIVLGALTHATENGVYISSGRALEVLAQMDTLVIDEPVLMYLNETYSDSVRAISALQQQGISIYLISYDNLNEKTSALADKFRIHPDFILPEAHSKHLNLVRGLQNQGRTVAVLTCNNDCTSKIGDVSISLTCAESGAETADVVLLDHQLWGLIYGIAIAKRAMEVIYENTAIIVVPNLMMQIGGGMLLGVNPVWNVIVNNSSALVAEFLNSARPHFDSIPLPSSASKSNTLTISPSSTDFAFPVVMNSQGYPQPV